MPHLNRWKSKTWTSKFLVASHILGLNQNITSLAQNLAHSKYLIFEWLNDWLLGSMIDVPIVNFKLNEEYGHLFLLRSYQKHIMNIY